MTPKKLPTIAGNFSTAFLASPLGASTSLFSHLVKTPSSFGGEPLPPHPPKTHVMASTIVEMVIESAVSIEKIVLPCSRNKVSLLILRCYLRVHPVCFVNPYRSLKILACQGQYSVMLPVFSPEYLPPKTKGPPEGILSISISVGNSRNSSLVAALQDLSNA